MKYFSVKRSIKIGGKICKPCICYELKDSLVFTVKSLVDSGIAQIHDDEVFFQNGKVIDKKAVVAKAKEKAKVEKAAKKKAKPTVADLKEMIAEPQVAEE